MFVSQNDQPTVQYPRLMWCISEWHDILTGKWCGQDFIMSFVFWTLSRMHVSVHWQRTRLYLDNELLFVLWKDMHRWTVQSKQAFRVEFSVPSETCCPAHWLSRVGMSFHTPAQFLKLTFCQQESRFTSKLGRKRGSRTSLPKRVPLYLTHSFNLTHVKGGIRSHT